MKKLELLKKVLLMLSVFALICGASVVSKATTGNVEDLLNDGNITNVEHRNTASGNTATNSQNTTQTNTSVNNANPANIAAVQNNKTNTTNTTTTLPKTGVSDTAMWLLIASCVIAAIYTYKKVRDYNI